MVLAGDVWASPFVERTTDGELLDTVTGRQHRLAQGDETLLASCAAPRPLALLPPEDRARAGRLIDELLLLDEATYAGIGVATLHTLDLEVAGACNAECIFCPRDELKRGRGIGIMKPEVFDNLLDTIGRFLRFVGIAGIGEPTLNKHLPTFVRRLTERGVATALVTNGSLLDDPLVDALLAAGLGTIQVSFNGNDRAAYEDHMLGLDFEETRRRVEGMIARIAGRIPVYVSAIQTSRNADKLGDFVAYWRARGVEAAIFPAHSRGGTIVQLVPRRPAATPPAPPRCGLFNTRSFVAWDGRILACCHDIDGATELGRLGTTTADQLIARKLDVMKRRAWFAVCAGCDEPARLAGMTAAKVLALR